MRKLVTTFLYVTAFAGAAFIPGISAQSSPAPASRFPVLQMNLCLSGQAGCYERTAYPSVLDEAEVQIGARDPEAVTLNEACRGDAAELARRAGYTLSFAAVHYGGAPLPCIEPRGRGAFGIAVLTRDSVNTTHTQPFAIQADAEERRWLCATTSDAVTVCTAHLSTRASEHERLANDAECRELRQVLARHQAAGRTLFGGDVNRQDPCSPTTMWVARDSSAGQLPGIQHIYGSTTPGESSSSVVEATYSDHDFLLAGPAL